MEKRTFCILDFPTKGEKYGNFKGLYPSNAAQKSFWKIIQKNLILLIIKKEKNNLVFHIQDINSKQIYKYIGTIVILKKYQIEIN